MATIDLTLEGLPIHGDILAKYVVVQLSPSGRAWDTYQQRMQFDHAMNAIWALDLTKPTRLVQVLKDGRLSVVRSWN